MLQRLVPKIFYADRAVGRDLFVDALRFAVAYEDDTITVVERDGCKAILVQDAAFAAKDRPEIAIETDAIDDLHADVAARRPDLLHPNPVVHAVSLRPWGAREFALLDASGVCIVLRQW
ncbi:MAG TPA: hypothetical protein VF457_12205 [Burkholderiaceae bacterium]